jgi:hypothetical protein
MYRLQGIRIASLSILRFSTAIMKNCRGESNQVQIRVHSDPADSVGSTKYRIHVDEAMRKLFV